MTMSDTTWNPESPYRMVGNSPVLRLTVREIARASKFDYPVLISGETGVGKELVARNIHLQSTRRAKQLVAVNCGGITESLLESELFGHDPHAFTGASNYARKGKIEEANGSTLFLDEVGELGNRGQGALLRVLQDNKIIRVGSNTERFINFRLICATNVSLEDALKDGRVRRDFYERINVIGFHIPPLREHTEDIPLLSAYFMNRYCGELKIHEKTFDAGALEVMAQYSWPGNIRELENVVKRLIAQLDDATVTKGDVDAILRSRYELTTVQNKQPESIVTASHTPSIMKDVADASLQPPKFIPALDEIALVHRALELGLKLPEYEELAVRIAYEKAGENQSAAARILGISRDQFRYRMEACGLLPPSKQRRERGESDSIPLAVGSFVILDDNFNRLYRCASSQQDQGKHAHAILGYRSVLSALLSLDGAISESTKEFYDAHIHSALGRCYFDNSEHEKAQESLQRSVDLYNKLLETGNNSDTLHFALGVAYTHLAHNAEAVGIDALPSARLAVQHFKELFLADTLPSDSLTVFYEALSHAEDSADPEYRNNLELQRSVLEQLADPQYAQQRDAVSQKLQHLGTCIEPPNQPN